MVDKKPSLSLFGTHKKENKDKKETVSGSGATAVQRAGTNQIQKEAQDVPYMPAAPSNAPILFPQLLLFGSNKKKKDPKALVKSAEDTGLSVKKESKKQITGRLLESSLGVAREDLGKRFKAVLLQEGLGNFKDCYYYTADALASAVPIFEGKKFYADHPSETEEMDRPERSVKEICGYYENVRVESAQDGRTQLCADLALLDGPSYSWARELALAALDYNTKHPETDLVGLSINADGVSGSVGIESFMNESAIPDSCKPKLLEAIAQGVTVVRPVTLITSAVSCDLVTEAGAGGRIAQLLEGNKKMKKEKKQEEMEKKEGEMPEQKSPAAPAPEKDAKSPDADPEKSDATDSEGNQPDADEDQDLIKKMLSKYLGEPEHDEETMACGKEAMQHAKDMGMEGEEAMKMAGYNVKMAKHLQKKEKGEPQGVDQAHPSPSDQKPMEAKQEEDESKKESAKKPDSELIRLTAENARMSKELGAIKLEKHIDKTLRESGLSMDATKKFRGLIKEAKSEKEVNDKFSLYKEAYLAGGEAGGVPFIINAEKQTDSIQGGLSFSDCLE